MYQVVCYQTCVLAIVFRIIWELSWKTLWTSPMFVLYKIDLVEESLQNCVLYHITRHTIFLNSVPSTYWAIYSHDTVEFQPLIGLVTGGNISFIGCANVMRGKRSSFFVRTAKYPQLLTIGYHTNALLPRKKKRNSVNWFLPSFSCITCF